MMNELGNSLAKKSNFERRLEGIKWCKVILSEKNILNYKLYKISCNIKDGNISVSREDTMEHNESAPVKKACLPTRHHTYFCSYLTLQLMLLGGIEECTGLFQNVKVVLE